MKLILKGVRCSFPSLFETEQYGGQDTGKYACTFLISKEDDAQVKKIKQAIKAAAEGKFGKPLPKGLASCLSDGDDVDYDGYAGMFSVKASTKKRPIVVDSDKSPIADSDDRVYAGCYINASLELWVQDNQYGKGVRAQLNGIQFVKDGDRFGSSNDSLDDFEELEAVADDSDPFDIPF